MQQRGVEVLDLHDLLAETLADPEARAWVLDRRITANSVGRAVAKSVRPWLDEMPAAKLAEPLIGGIAMEDLPKSEQLEPAAGRAWAARHSWCRRSPTRSSSATRPAGSTAASPAIRCTGPPASRRRCCSAPSTSSIPTSSGGDFKFWFGDSDEDFTGASMEGGDVMPIGNGVVLIGMGERTTHQAVGQVARELFKHEAATQVIACVMPKSRAAMHLDTVFSLCDRDACTIFREVVDQIACYSIRPDGNGGIDVRAEERPMLDVVRDALGLNALRVIETGGDAWRGRARAVGRRQQRRRARARRRRRLRPQHLHQHPAAQGRDRGDHRPRLRARARARRRTLHDLPDLARAGRLTRPPQPGDPT